MAATFTSSLPTDRDWLRVDLGDTGATGVFLLDDETYDAYLTEYGDKPTALGYLARALIARVEQEPDKAALGGGVSFDWTKRLNYWWQIAAGAGLGGVAVLTGVRYVHDPYDETLADEERAP